MCSSFARGEADTSAELRAVAGVLRDALAHAEAAEIGDGARATDVRKRMRWMLVS